MATLLTVDDLNNYTNDLMLVLPEEGPVPFLHSFRRSVDGHNCFSGWIQAAESLQNTGKYRASRLNSAILEIRSDTRPGGNYDISGNFNAVTMPFIPPNFQELDHNQLIRFKDTPADVRTNVPILDGIVWRKPIHDENPMLLRSGMAGTFNYG